MWRSSCLGDRFLIGPSPGSGLGELGFDEFADVFAEHVELDIEAVADLFGVQMGDLMGVRDDPADDTGRGDFGGGKGDAIETDGALGDHEPAMLGGEFDFQAMVLAVKTPVEHAHGGIHMPLDEVAAKACSHGHGALQIDEAAGFEIAKAGDAESLHEQVKAGGLPDGIKGGDREAAAIDGYAFAFGEFGGHGADIQGQAGAFAARFEAEDGAGGFDEAGEHGLLCRASERLAQVLLRICS
jgi:hypothetical protein